MPSFEFQCSPEVLIGAGRLDDLRNLPAQFGARRILLVSDPGITRCGLTTKAFDLLTEGADECHIFDKVEENPTARNVGVGSDFAQQCGTIDLIVGLGGGSAMDCAKGINFIYTNGGTMEDYWGVNRASKPLLPSIGIPTTAGTGSEAQSFAVIAQDESHRKMACGDRKAKFATVILDPLLAPSAPREVVAATGLDAMAHAVESYVSTRRNLVSQMFAAEAWRLLNRNYEAVLAGIEDNGPWLAMLTGAHFAGVAIEHSMLGAAHACANPLAARFKVSHGVAVALMLPPVMRYNEVEMARDYEMLGGGAEDMIERLSTVRSEAGLPQQLREIAVPEEVLPDLAADAAEQWTARFNPRPLGLTDFLELYQAAF
jgi:alcohol dehydrogenase